MDANTKRSFDILGLNERSTFEDVEKAYRLLVARKSSWNDVKEINWAYESVKRYFLASSSVPASEQDEAGHHTGDPPAFVPRTPKRTSQRRTIFLLGVPFLVILLTAAFFFGFSRFNPFRSTRANDLSVIIKAVKPAIVTIITDDRPRGSGFLISKDGYIATNAHVMREKTGKVSLSDGSVLDVDLVLLDPDRDFALLKTKGSRDYPYLAIGDSSKVSEGETVIAAGTPLSFETTFTRGIISSSRRSFPAYKASFIQTDAALSPGNSGGPLINLAGDAIGINTLKISGLNVEGMGFAVSINDVKQHIVSRQHMSDSDLTRELARTEKKIEEMNQWRDDASRGDEKRLKDRVVEEQWERERRRRELADRVNEANRDLMEQKEKEERRLREEANSIEDKCANRRKVSERPSLNACRRQIITTSQRGTTPANRSIRVRSADSLPPPQTYWNNALCSHATNVSDCTLSRRHHLGLFAPSPSGAQFTVHSLPSIAL